MDSHRKTRSVLGGVVIAVGFLTWMLSQMHGCDLKSLWIEFPMLLGFLVVVPAWARGAGTLRRLILRSVGAVILVMGLEMGYLSWLHSDYFPRWLLFPKPRIHHRAPNQGAAANRRPAGQLDGSGNLFATVAADRAFPAAVAELGRSP
jgi:hypothetical protein